MQVSVFFSTWKRCASRFCEGSTERQLQIIDMELFGANCVFGNLWKMSKVSKLVQFWVQAVCLTTRLRRVIGCLQTRWLDASKPLVLAGAVPSGVFFSAQKASKKKLIRIYYKFGVFVCFPKNNFVVYHDQGHDQGHSSFLFQNSSISMMGSC